MKDLQVIQFSQKRWLPNIIQAVASGETVMIEEIDATLNPVLFRSTVTRGMKIIQFGAEEVDQIAQHRDGRQQDADPRE